MSIRVSARLNLDNEFAGSFSLVEAQSGAQNIANIQEVGTSAEAIVLGDVAPPFWLYLENLGPTNYVEVDSANTFDNFSQKIPAGKGILLLPQTATIYAKANTAGISLKVTAVEL